MYINHLRQSVQNIVTHTVHQAQKVFIIYVHTDLVVLVVATLYELDFWECAHSGPLSCFVS